MKENNGIKVSLTDRMVIVGLALGVIYWLIETFLYIISTFKMTFSDRLFGPDLYGLSTRIIVLCLFLIFGSHSQYTIRKRKQAEAEREDMKDVIEKLEKEIRELKEN